MDQPVVERPSLASGAPLDASTVAEAFQRTVHAHGDRVALRTLDDAVRLTWSELDGRVRKLTAGLAALGLRRGETIALLLPNTIECHLVDFAALHLGAVPFTIYNSSPPESIAHQLRNAGAQFIVTARAFLPQVHGALELLGEQDGHIVVVDGMDDITTLETVEAAGDPSFDFDASWQALTPDDLVTLIYTSGTTGPPKGVEWSHRTVLAQQRGLDAAVPMPSDGLISFLPMAHAGGRTTVHYLALAYGAAITVCPDMGAVPQYLAAVHPDAFFSTPRLWEKLQVAIESMIASNEDEAVRQALEVGLKRVLAEDVGAASPAGDSRVTDAEGDGALTVLRPLLERLGLDRIKAAFVGGAPCTPEIVQFFRAVGVPLLEAYGLTEGSLNIFNRVDQFKTGTAGTPLPGVELRLAPDGELLCRSEMNMVAYRREPELTAAVLDSEGWLSTGDIAEIDADGYVSIVDRKKEIMISSAGKNMSPANIEAAIKGESSLLGQVVSIGDGRRYVTALITLDPEAARRAAAAGGLDTTDLADIVGLPAVFDQVSAAVERGNARLLSPERVRKFVVLPMAWLPDSDELTPTAKLKRKPIAAKYADQINGLYAD